MELFATPSRKRTRPRGVPTRLASAVLVSVALVAGCGADVPSSPVPPSNTTAAQSTSPSTAATSTLTGQWTDEKRNVYAFTSGGADAYVGELQTLVSGVCAPLNIRVSGTSGHYEGTMAFYQVTNSVCGAFLGDGTVIIDMAANGSTAQVRWAGPASGRNCLNCTPHTWTRH